MPETEHVPLSPLSFLERSADVFPDKTAVVTRSGLGQTYAQFRAEAARVADSLRARGVGQGDQVAVLARNGPDALRMHFGVPGAKATLVALNIRLAPEEYEYILADSAAAVLFVEPALWERIHPVADRLSCEIVALPDADTGVESVEIGTAYSEWLSDAPDTGLGLQPPENEYDAIAINYTSGTTGRPKGAVYTHRGAYLNALGVILELQVGPADTYLWTLPMFHCNGWCFTWGVTAVGGTHVSLADFEPDAALDLIARHRVSHLCGAPVVLNALASRGNESGRRFDHAVRIATGGAPPSPTTIAAMHDLGIDVVHLYGLTETYGPSIVCEVQPHWGELKPDAYAEALSRQGVRTINVERVRVVDDAFRDVQRDGTAMGEIVIRSNTVVAGYHGDQEQTSEVIKDGWLYTGDLAVVHPDGYIEVRDRSKDIIISGGESISSIEVENVLVSHADVLEAAVVAAPHDKWGEVPVAFVSLRPAAGVREEELIEHVRARIAHFKAPKSIVFTELPKTSTGKIQKYELREKARTLGVR